MRTSNVIKAELELAKIEMNNHFNECSHCQDPPTFYNDETEHNEAYPCLLSELLSNDVDNLESELSYFNEVFQQEMEERLEALHKLLNK